MLLLNNLKTRKIINPNKNHIQIHVLEFLPIEIQNRPLLVKAFYSDTPMIFSADQGTLMALLLDTLFKANALLDKQSYSDHIMQVIFDILEDQVTDASIHDTHTDVAFRAAEYIWNHYAEKLHVSDVSTHFYVSKSHLEKLFREVHNMSIGAYIRTVRVYHVKALLEKTPDLSVLDAAYTCGFNSSSGFYKAYKAVTNENPRPR